MPRFQFKLRRLLRVREVGEELARAELAAAEHDRQIAQDALDTARSDLIGAEVELAQLRASGDLRADAALVAERTLPPLLRRIAHRRALAQQADRIADEARRVWQSARTDVRALEKLEDRARVGFAADDRAREDRASQEVVERRSALSGQKARRTEIEA